MRKISASREIYQKLRALGQPRLEVTGFFYVDPPSDVSNRHLSDWKTRVFQMSDQRKEELFAGDVLTSPLVDRVPGLKKYEITCKNCNEVQGWIMAQDKYLTNWCDFHYYQWTDGTEWKGCFTPHVSAVTGELCLECACGQDTRDFTLNRTLPGLIAYQIEQENKKGRKFGFASSAFKLKEVKNG